MGEPVRILDLARDMIRLSGFEPDVDIPITFTGLRPGEKLEETLVWNEERIVPSGRERLFLVQRDHYTEPERVFEMVERFREFALRCDEAGAKRYLQECVPSLAEHHLAVDSLTTGYPVTPRLLDDATASSAGGGR